MDGIQFVSVIENSLLEKLLIGARGTFEFLTEPLVGSKLHASGQIVAQLKRVPDVDAWSIVVV